MSREVRGVGADKTKRIARTTESWWVSDVCVCDHLIGLLDVLPHHFVLS